MLAEKDPAGFCYLWVKRSPDIAEIDQFLPPALQICANSMPPDEFKSLTAQILTKQVPVEVRECIISTLTCTFQDIKLSNVACNTDNAVWTQQAQERENNNLPHLLVLPWNNW